MKSAWMSLVVMETKDCIVQIEIDDDYKDILLVGILKADKKMIEYFLEENDYWHPDDRLADEETLHGLNILLKYYEVQSEVASTPDKV